MNNADDYQVGGNHYRKSIQPWTAMEAWMSHEQFIGFLRGNCIKYSARLGDKDLSSKDARKIAHYATKLAEVLEQAEPSPQMELPLGD